VAEISQQHAGIRARLWFGGKFITRDPVPIQWEPKRFETKTRTSNLGSRIDRCFTLGPNGGQLPNIRNRRSFTLPWSDLREPGMLEHVDILANIGQPFPLGLWKQEYDVFDGDGQNQTFFLQRRLLLCAPGGALPPITYGDFCTRVLVYSKSYLDSTAVLTEYEPTMVAQEEIDTGDPEPDVVWMSKEGQQFGNLWLTKVRFGTPPPNAFDNVVVVYLPLYEVTVDAEQARSFLQSMVEPRIFRVSEFG